MLCPELEKLLDLGSQRIMVWNFVSRSCNELHDEELDEVHTWKRQHEKENTAKYVEIWNTVRFGQKIFDRMQQKIFVCFGRSPNEKTFVYFRQWPNYT
jgi:hypothetical protein